MAMHEKRGRTRRNADRIPTRMVFSEAPGIPGTLTVGAEHHDIVIRVDLAESSCTLELTPDDALTLGMWLSAHIVDERRRWSAPRGSGAPCVPEPTLRQLANLSGADGKDVRWREGVADLGRLPQDRTERLWIIMAVTLVAIGNFASAVLAAVLVMALGVR
jgi:hypothetical protein